METSVPPPPPPPPSTDDDGSSSRIALFATGPPRPGGLTSGWRLIVLTTWVLVVLAYSGVWKASRELGLSTWWLGPPGAPRPLPFLLLPFVAPAAMIVATLNNSRRLVWYGMAAGAAGIVIAVGDLGGVRRFGLIELSIGVAGVAVSVASSAGRYRRRAVGA